MHEKRYHVPANSTQVLTGFEPPFSIEWQQKKLIRHRVYHNNHFCEAIDTLQHHNKPSHHTHGLPTFKNLQTDTYVKIVGK